MSGVLYFFGIIDYTFEILTMQSLGAKIITFEEFQTLRDQLGTIVATSGFFDPIHPGHISCFIESKKLGDTLVVIVNGDSAARLKKGKPFQDLLTRCSIVSGIRSVDYVVPFEIEADISVVKALEWLRPHIFTKGGDRMASNIPEVATCQKYGIKIVDNVGRDKEWSSSTFLKEWGEFIKQKS